MALNVGELFATLEVKDDAFDSGLRRAETKGKASGKRIGSGIASGIGGPLKTAGAAMAGLFVADKVVGFFKDSVGAASDLNETVNKSSVIFGKSSAGMEAWASGGAQAFGLSKQAALEAASGFGDMFSQLGLGGDQAAKMSKGIVQMSADLGSFNNLPTAEVTDMIAGAMRGEYDSLQRVIPNINAARVQTEALNETHKKSASDLTAAEKAQATYNIIQKDGKRAAGDFARTSNGLANSQKIAAAEFENAKAKLGGAFLPVMTKVTNFISAQVIPTFVRFMDYIGQHWPEIWHNAQRVIHPVVAILQTAWHVVQTNRSTLESLGRTLIKIAPYLIAVGAAVVIMTNPWLLAVAAIIGLIAIYPRLRSATDTAINAVKGAWSATERAVRGATAHIVSAFLTMAADIVGAAAHAFGWVPGLGGKLKGAQRSIEEFRDRTNAALNGVHDKDINIRVHDFAAPDINKYRDINGNVIATTFVEVHARNRTGGTPVPSLYADGGFVTGPGGPRTDSIYARLSAGEFVVDAENTRRNRDVLEAINAGKTIRAPAGNAVVGGGMGIDAVAQAFARHVGTSGLTLKLHRSAGSVMATIVNDENAWRAGRG